MAAQDFNIEQSSGDLVIKDGDFFLVESDQQHIEHILISKQGDWKQWPIVGVGIQKYFKSPVNPKTSADAEGAIRVQLLYDNMKVTTLQMNSIRDVKIDAKRDE